MIFRIPKGKHYARPWRFWLWWNKRTFSWNVKFTPSCKYNLGNEDQLDQNKMCGIGYLPHHHKNSARFGWRYRPDRNEIELSAYCYVDGERIIRSIAFVKVNQECKVNLTVGSDHYYFDVLVSTIGRYENAGMITVGHNLKRKLQYRLGLYFGGNRTAPWDMAVHIDRVG